MSKKLTRHLRVLIAQLERLEAQGHLEPGQLAAARRIVQRMKRALKETAPSSKQSRQRLHEAVRDFLALFIEVNDQSVRRQ